MEYLQIDKPSIKHLRQEKADLGSECMLLLKKAQSAANEKKKTEYLAAYDKKLASLETVNADIKTEERKMDLERSLDWKKTKDDEPSITGGDENRPPFKSLSEQLLSVRNQALGMGADPRLHYQAIQGAGEAVNSDGGFLVQQDFASEILKRMYDTGDILSRVNKMPLSAMSNGLTLPAIDETSRVDGSRLGGVQAFWLEEGGALTASKPKLRDMNLKLKKVAALVYATSELTEDSPSFTKLINDEVPKELLFKVEDAIVSGDGAGKPKGFNATGGGGAVVTVSKETGQTANTIVVENILKMFSRLYARSIRDSVWLINQDVQPQLFTMGVTVGTGGVPVYLPPSGVAGTPFGTLMGRPIIISEYMETIGTAGDIMLVDLSQYIFIDKSNIKSDVSIHVRFLNDENAFRFIYRVDGQSSWNAPLTPFKGTNTVSPFIRLETRS